MEISLNQNETQKIDTIPNQCPYCHRLIQANYRTFNRPRESNLELILECSNFDCKKLFIAYYQYSQYYGGEYRLQRTNKGNIINATFSDEIEAISCSFVEIYNQAYFAEQNNLSQICGVGYRKALEYLIKDYLIFTKPELEDSIKNKFLGSCIKDLIDDEKIKSVSKRAVWLGNDETHYTRKWITKDLNDMKKLIKLTVHWIEMERLTESFEEEMPE